MTQNAIAKQPIVTSLQDCQSRRCQAALSDSDTNTGSADFGKKKLEFVLNQLNFVFLGVSVWRMSGAPLI